MELLYLFFMFSSFFRIIRLLFKVQNPACSSRYDIKNLQLPWEKVNPPSLSDMEPTAHPTPNKKPLTC